ncbi:MAG TPA: MFS transporter [Hypericibacter adhaerens]|jgi:UMF1 family MFS transporter|uniref:MFS transporter n=2 Tax=Hypericibacter adhaerens TaxID=2602016 RepID=A0A5J6N7T8_9PROT|nr:MFS transporter [Hypericibacter adhaerens]HWA44851.1 MFS transporter [Hypericibacter adhaerens]
MPKRAVLAWCFFDWANSAFPTVVQTFLFSAYFTSHVAADPASGTAAWGQATGIAALAIALLSPPLGAVADVGGRRKPWLAALTLLTVLATAALWFVRPDPAFALLGLVAMALGTVGFELGTVFYNAMLPGLVAPARIGRISGWAWGLGYAGGLVCLAVALLGFVLPAQPLFGLDKASAEHVRAAMLLTALWFALFSLPLFLLVPDRAATGRGLAGAVGDGLAQLLRTFRDLRRHANIARFLLAKMIYIDGLNTLFAFGGIYAAGQFGMSLEQVLIFGIALNVTAGLGAAGFAWVDDWVGAKPTILISLVATTLLGVAILLTDDVAWFWGLALGIGIFLGPTQAASRSMMARLAPPALATEFFGLYALAGKATAFFGPWALAAATAAFDSQRAGMATIPPFLVLGFLLLLWVREPKRAA